jgi:hypothetical protein
MATKRALLIGINYSGQSQLYGCINDIIQIQGVLIDAYGFKPEEIRVLRDDDPSMMPTKARILAAMEALVQENPQVVYVHYSGHGTNIRDVNRDEADGMDECIVPSDYATSGLITDDQINSILGRLRGTGMAIFDCCRSGTVMDLPHQGVQTTNQTVTQGGMYCFSGCQDNDYAAETVSAVSNLPQGAMTTALIAVIRKQGYYPAIGTLYTELKKELASNGFSQVPNLTSSIPVTPTTPHPLPRPVYLAQIQDLQQRLQQAQAQLTDTQQRLQQAQAQQAQQAKQTQQQIQQAQLALSRQLATANGTISSLRENNAILRGQLSQALQRARDARK